MIYVRCYFSPILFFSLSGYIIPFSKICLRSVHRSSRFVCLPVLEDDSRRNIIVDIVIDKEDGTLFHFLTQVYIGAAEVKPRIPVMSMLLKAVAYCLPESAKAWAATLSI